MGIYIGRLQPLHNAHLAAIQLALSNSKRLAIVLGSACQAKTIKNPWTTAERERMLRACLTEEQNARVSIIAAKDYLYRDNVWLSALQSGLSNIGLDDITEDGKITLFGHDKDRSTYYLHLFPMWSFEDTGDLGDIDATRVRAMFFTGQDDELKKHVPWPVYQQLVQEMGPSPGYQNLVEEYKHILEYKKLWANAPFPPTFVTTDAVIIKSGHVLLVKRRGYPGRGLFALPGGFLEQHERIIDGCLRETGEETQLGVPKEELKKRIVEQRVFDHPDRSLRGRTITHASCIDLGSGPLPKVKGADDADPHGTGWMPLRDVFANEEGFFEDHFHIVDFFVSRY